MIKTKKLTEGAIAPLLFKMTIPMLFGMFSMMIFNIIDTYFIAKLGTSELAAISFTFPVIMFVMCIALGISTGVSSVISRFIGMGEHSRVKRITSDSAILALTAGAVFIVIGFLTMKPVFFIIGAEGEIYSLIESYMRVWYLGVGFVFIPIVCNHAIRAGGDMLSPAIIMALGAAINLILDPIMIYGLFGFPRLEMVGAALATVIARFATLVFALYVLRYKKHMIEFKLPKLSELVNSWRHILSVGMPAAVTNLFFSLTMGVVTGIIAIFGPEAVAAAGAGIKVEQVALIAYFAVMTALAPFFGQNWGAGELDRVEKGQKISNHFSVYWGLGCFVIFLIFGRRIGMVFSADPKVIEGIYIFLIISSASYGFRGICMIAVSMFNAINMPLRAAMLNVIRMFGLSIPLAYLGAHYYGLKGVFVGISISNLIAGVFSLIWVHNICMKCEMEKVASARR